ncbi:7418_t:CDS:2 [Funneliformis mosseae]|uniref:7418_t:CDS:1 n=1 Tax=Funneliformis mosseae TaxID=27381 RepID=A0A9N9AX68_FUNMO|nr:7418_t:CDS:2 [Funneliformis mosseae]
MDLRLESFALSIAKIYFTDAVSPPTASNPIPPPNQFIMRDFQGRNVARNVVDGVICYVVNEHRGYELILNGNPIVVLRSQVQQSVELADGITHFVF